jgi:hypothetical protein
MSVAIRNGKVFGSGHNVTHNLLGIFRTLIRKTKKKGGEKKVK